MKMPAGLTAVLLTLGCAGPEVHYDYDAAADFAGMHSYDWSAPAPAALAQAHGVKQPLMDARVRRAVEQELAVRHFRKETQAVPDFLVTYYPIYPPRRSRANSPGGVGVGMAFGFRGPGLGIGVAGPLAVPSDGGTPSAGILVLEIKAAPGGQLLWRAEAEHALDPAGTPEEADQDVAVAVRKMLAQFPPVRPHS